MMWDCGTDDTFSRFSRLPRATECASRDFPHGIFKIQNDEQAKDMDLHLKHGTGIPVGGRTGRTAVVVAFHFPAIGSTLNGMTGETEVRFRLKKKTPDVKTAGVLIMSGIGFIGGDSVSSVSASWTLDANIGLHPVLVHTHTHSLGCGVEVSIQRKGAEQKVPVFQADLRLHRGFDRLTPEPPALRQGDTLTVQCVYNNTRTENIRVW